jgi:hypothetical protein
MLLQPVTECQQVMYYALCWRIGSEIGMLVSKEQDLTGDVRTKILKRFAG